MDQKPNGILTAPPQSEDEKDYRILRDFVEAHMAEHTQHNQQLSLIIVLDVLIVLLLTVLILFS